MRNLKYTMLHFGGRYILLFTAIAALTLSACKKDDKDEQSGGTSNLAIDSITGTHEIYVALSFDSIYSSGHSHSYAAYYHNGLKLLPQTTNSDAYANSIFVEDTNVYVGGSDGTSAVYWKNGEENVLPQGTSVSSIYVRNGVVYACGYEATSTGNSARCWVGDENVKELDGTIAEGITVDRNGTVYVTGYLREPSKRTGIPTLLGQQFRWGNVPFPD
jgi:alpha-tubulin suppressor-like RCC1 family protein